MKYATLYPKEQKALDFIESNPLADIERLAEHLEVKAKNASVYVSNLQKKGYIETKRVLVPKNKKIKVVNRYA